jgi:CPA1 family monovalent cation:H+ antiporter
MTLQQRGYLAFHAEANYEALEARLDGGWTVQTKRLGERYGLKDLEARLGERGRDWVLLGGVTPDGAFALHSVERPIAPGPGWAVVVFAAGQSPAPGPLS